MGVDEKVNWYGAGSNDAVSTTDDSTVSDLDDMQIEEEEDAVDEDSKCDEHAQHIKEGTDELNEDYNLRMKLSLLEARLNQRLGDGDQLVVSLVKVIEHLCCSAQGTQLTPFHSSSIPTISLLDYATRMRRFMQCSDACFALALVFVDRLVKSRRFQVCKANVHRLLATSVVLAAKCHDDVFYSNAYYAKVVGMKTAELNKLESLFLRLVGWRVHVDAEELERYLCAIAPSST